jgi:hypothetical protein
VSFVGYMWLGQVPWYWSFYQFGTTATLGCGAVVSAVVVVLGVPQVTKPFVTASLAATAAVAVVTAGLTFSASGGRIGEVLPPVAVFITAAAIAAGVAVAEAVLAPLCAGCSVLLLATSASYHSAHPSAWTTAESAGTALVIHVGLLEGIALLSIAINAAHWRWRRAHGQEAHSELAVHATVMAAVAVGDSGVSLPVVRQLLNEMLLGQPSWQGICPAGKCRVGKVLGPLLARAYVAAPLLRRKAEEWALLSHGYFPFAVSCNSHKLIEWSIASREPTLAANIQWPPVLAKKMALCRLGHLLATNSSNSPACPAD